jgi:hypothetical protein
MERYPGYLGLLKWSLAQYDPTASTEAKHMDEDVRRRRIAAVVSCRGVVRG